MTNGRWQMANAQDRQRSEERQPDETNETFCVHVFGFLFCVCFVFWFWSVPVAEGSDRSDESDWSDIAFHALVAP